jgi:hypothetical protein
MNNALQRKVLCGLLLATGLACDGSTCEVTTSNEMNRAQVSSACPKQGEAKVKVVLNAVPRITAMTSSADGLMSESRVILQVLAGNPDGDSLGFAWKSGCPGAFDRSDRSRAVFTAESLPSGATCRFEVEVNDGHGGVAKGNLVLSAARSMINIALAMGIVYQSTGHTEPNEVVLLHSTASDPEGENLTWYWHASDGVILDQNDQSDASEVHWKIPVIQGARFAITVTAMDPEGVEVSFSFTVVVS